jgi:hypothetical protein
VTTIDLTTWAALIGTWALVVGTLSFAYWQLRQTQRLHSATTLLDLREKFYSPRMCQARRELSGWLLTSDRGPEPDNWEVGLFFQLLGSLTHTGALDKRLVWSAFGTWISAYYVFARQPVDLLEQWRKESGDPLIFAEFEWLARQVIEFDRRAVRGPEAPDTLVNDARTVLESETRISDQSIFSIVSPTLPHP